MNAYTRLTLCTIPVLFLVLIVFINGSMWAPIVLLEKFTQSWLSAIILFVLIVTVAIQVIFK